MANGSEAKYAKYSRGWYFSKYTRLDHNDLTAEVPICFGLTTPEIVRLTTQLGVAWDGDLTNLPFTLAIELHQQMYWTPYGLDTIWTKSPAALDAVMKFGQLQDFTAMSELVSDHVSTIASLANLDHTSVVQQVILDSLDNILGRLQLSMLLYHSLFAKVISTLCETQAPINHIQQIYMDFNTNSSQVKNTNAMFGVQS